MSNESQPFPRFVSIGEALTDMIRTGESDWISKVGGATWNVARVMAKLGVRSAFAGAISKDIFGDALWYASAEAGLDTRYLQRLEKAPLLAIVYETHPPKYFFVGDDSADLHFDLDALPSNWQQHAQWAHFGGISLARAPLSDTLVALAAELKTAGVKISYDPNFRVSMDSRYDATFRRMSELADVIKISDDDLIGLFRSDDHVASLATLRSWNANAIILYTRGAAGATLYVDNRTWHCAAPAVEVADTVGAGDASIGGLLFSLMQHSERDWPEHLWFAVCAGAAGCLAVGAAPPSLELAEALFLA